MGSARVRRGAPTRCGSGRGAERRGAHGVGPAEVVREVHDDVAVRERARLRVSGGAGAQGGGMQAGSPSHGAELPPAEAAAEDEDRGRSRLGAGRRPDLGAGGGASGGGGDDEEHGRDV